MRSYLGPVETVGKRIDCFDSIDSTNAYLKRIALDGAPDGTVAVAAEQTSGRGRRGRSFQSAAGKGVYLSILLRPKLAPSQLMPLTGLIAVAMSRAVDRVAGTHSQIKWTNDLILNGRKLCGILTELSVEGETGELQYVVAGIGFNVSQREEDFVGEVSKIATSILRETGRLISRAELSAAMIEELDALYTALRSGETSGYLDEYRRRCVTIARCSFCGRIRRKKSRRLTWTRSSASSCAAKTGRSRPSARVRCPCAAFTDMWSKEKVF